MDFRKYLFVDSSGKPSSTLTAFLIGFTVVNVKLLLSGIEIYDIKMSPFTGVEYGAALAALGAIYVLRRNSNDTKQ